MGAAANGAELGAGDAEICEIFESYQMLLPLSMLLEYRVGVSGLVVGIGVS